MIHFVCPNCEKSLKVANSSAGKLAPCPACKSPLVVPESLGSPARVEAALPDTRADYFPEEDLEEQWKRGARGSETWMLLTSLLVAGAMPVAIVLALSRPDESRKPGPAA